MGHAAYDDGMSEIDAVIHQIGQLDKSAIERRLAEVESEEQSLRELLRLARRRQSSLRAIKREADSR